LSETSPVEAALKNLTSLEASLDELRKRVEARKTELLRLAQERGEEAYGATIKEVEGERTSLIEAVRKSAESEASQIVAQGRREMDEFEAKARGSKDAVRAFIVQILMSEA
jgi:vacuolar-type H+-ATPase subunit H